MAKFYRVIASCSFLAFSLSNLHALDLDITHNCIGNFPKVTEQRALNLIDMAMNAQKFAEDLDRNNYISALHLVKREVEYMMSAKMRLDDFIDDAFDQAAKRGIKISDWQKDQCRRSLTIIHKGFNLNNMAYQTYEEQKSYQTPVRLEAGLTLVIIGSVIAVIPYPGCAPAGQLIAGTGFAFMAEACVSGLEKNKK
jgi:hypothetical protein